MSVFRAILVAGVLAAPVADAGSEQRTLVVRERYWAELLDGAFTFQVLKLRGYSIDVRLDGKRRKLKMGETFSPPGSACQITFKKISPETRIARFVTDCQ